jgi:hypothetical protein
MEVTDSADDPLMAALQRSLEGSYRLLRLLGRGGMGAVYLARDLSLDRLVAIKVLHQDRALPPQARELRREARTAARLTHPNIVPLHGIGEVSGLPYFVMGYVAGESMGARLQREGRLGVDRAVRMLGEIAEALDYAHRQGVVHRDVKPENVMLEEGSGRALLSDFGLAKAMGVDSTMSSGHVLGTPHYMSPEQASGAPADERSDVYSLGVMAYRVLSGRLPFQSTDLRELLMKHVREAPPPLEDQAPGLPGPLVAAVHRCLAKNPVQRWPHARAFRLAISGDWSAAAGAASAGLAGQGPFLLLWAAAVAAFLAAPFVVFGVTDPTLRRDLVWGVESLAWSVALFTLLAYGLLQLRSLGRASEAGFTSREMLPMLFRQPAWWMAWWPAALRWPGDVWPRLPPLVKAMRCLTLVPLAVLAVGIALTLVLGRPSTPAGWGLSAAGITVAAFLATTFLTVVGIYALPRGWSELCGLPTMEPERWRDPMISRHLRTAREGAALTERATPGQHAEALGHLAEEISGPARAVAEQAAAAGRRLAATLAELERQAAALARHADDEELKRLEDRLALLGPPAPGEPAETAELRRLLTRQQDLLRPMEDRLHMGQANRERMRALLAGPHREVTLLQQALQADAGAWREATARIEDLCREAQAMAPEPTATEVAATRTR